MQQPTRRQGGVAYHRVTTDGIDHWPRVTVLTGLERHVLEQLTALVRTPRAAKRLVNTYKILRSCLSFAERAEFESNGGQRAALVLLAVYASWPAAYERFIGEVAQSDVATLQGFVAQLPSGDQDQDWSDLLAALRSVRLSPHADPTRDEMLSWCRLVDRFTLSGRRERQ
jgi:hypothetical protein